MSTMTATALVVRGTDWSETSRIATLFTREYGTVRALAKGGRRLNAKFEIAFDLLAVCHVAFIHKTHGGLDLLTEAQGVQRFPHLRTDLGNLYAGYYIAELLADGTAEMDPHPALYDAALATLRGLADAPASRPGRVMAFELAWMEELGYAPRLEDCASCGTPLNTSEVRVAFSPAAGGGLCPDCTPVAADRRWVSRPAWEALRQLSATPTLPPPIRTELRGLFSQTVCYRLSKRPRLLSYIEADRPS
jgi:DNA repair protein RecO (recombination protein O)